MSICRLLKNLIITVPLSLGVYKDFDLFFGVLVDEQERKTIQ